MNAEVFGKDRRGIWHRATATYPSAMDTLCGKDHWPALVFRARLVHSDPLFFFRCDDCERIKEQNDRH